MNSEEKNKKIRNLLDQKFALELDYNRLKEEIEKIQIELFKLGVDCFWDD